MAENLGRGWKEGKASLFSYWIPISVFRVTCDDPVTPFESKIQREIRAKIQQNGWLKHWNTCVLVGKSNCLSKGSHPCCWGQLSPSLDPGLLYSSASKKLTLGTVGEPPLHLPIAAPIHFLNQKVQDRGCHLTLIAHAVWARILHTHIWQFGFACLTASLLPRQR